MNSYQVTEYNNDTIEPTGYQATYLARTFQEAIEKVLYTARLTNGNAKLGPTGRVVHTGRGTSLVVAILRRQYAKRFFHGANN